MIDASIRRTPLMDAPRSTLEYSITLSVSDGTLLRHRGERAEVGIGHPGPRADEDRADDAGRAHLGAFLDHHAADQLASRVHDTAPGGFRRLQHEPVDLEHV